MNGIERNVSNKIKELLKMFPVVAIIGVRQCGKSTLIKNLHPDWQYYDLERPSHFELINYDTEFFLAEHSEKVIFDEAQLCPKLFSVLRSTIDEKRDQYGRFIISGSSSYDLLKNISESLAGRVAIVELGTLKHNEIENLPISPLYDLLFSKKNVRVADLKKINVSAISAKKIKDSWFFGGYPEPVLRRKKTPAYYAQWMENYFATYINRDVRRLFPNLNLQKYQRFISMLANLSGTIVVRKELAQAIEVSEPTIKDYLDIAHGTFVWRNIPSFEKNPNKAVMKMPKGHFRDNGLLHYLLKLNDPSALEVHPIIGRSFETFIIEELLKGLEATPITNWQYYYYRTRNKAEIDLILDGPFGVVPIEIKAGLGFRESQLKSMKIFLEEMKLPFGIVINQSTTIEMISDKIIQLPALLI